MAFKKVLGIITRSFSGYSASASVAGKMVPALMLNQSTSLAGRYFFGRFASVRGIRERPRSYGFSRQQYFSRVFSSAPAAAGSKFVRWEMPESDFIKINVDASFMTHPEAKVGIGGIFRDSLGEFDCAFTEKLYSISTSEVAEFRAALKGIEIAVERGYKKIILEADCKEVTDHINKWLKKKDNLTELINEHCEGVQLEKKLLLEKIVKLLSQVESIEVVHTYREANHLADIFAKIAAYGPDGLTIYDSLRDCGSSFRWAIARNLFFDKKGMERRRVIKGVSTPSWKWMDEALFK